MKINEDCIEELNLEIAPLLSSSSVKSDAINGTLSTNLLGNGDDKKSPIRFQLDKRYEMGIVTRGKNFLPANDVATDNVIEKVIEKVRSALEDPDIERGEAVLDSEFTGHQLQIAYLALIHDMDLHIAMERYNSRMFTENFVINYVKDFMQGFIRDTDKRAIASRAVVGTAAEIGLRSHHVINYGAFQSFGVMEAGFCGIGSAIVFSVFSVIELYRYASGAISKEKVRYL